MPNRSTREIRPQPDDLAKDRIKIPPPGPRKNKKTAPGGRNRVFRSCQPTAFIRNYSVFSDCGQAFGFPPCPSSSSRKGRGPQGPGARKWESSIPIFLKTSIGYKTFSLTSLLFGDLGKILVFCGNSRRGAHKFYTHWGLFSKRV